MVKQKGFLNQMMIKLKEDNITILAAGLAYYFLLTVFPLMIVFFAIIPYFNLSPDEVVHFISNILPSEIATLIEDNIVSHVITPQSGLLTIGIVSSLWSASSGINAFIKSSNDAYHVVETRSIIEVRLCSLILTIGFIFSIVISIMLIAFGDITLNFVRNIIEIHIDMEWLLEILRWLISPISLTIYIITLYRMAPNKRIPVKHIIPGAALASILWLTISFGFSLYVSNFGNYSVTYGSLGGIIILMIWFYLTGFILIIGLVLTAIYHNSKIKKVEPYPS